jgi:hypothetical protein
MRLAPPFFEGLKPALASWLKDLYAAFAQGLGFPARFQMGGVFVTTRTGAPATHTDLDDDPTGSLYLREGGGASTSLYVKEAAGGGGWVAK